MAQGMALVADGQGEAGAASARRAVAILEQSDELRDDPGLLAWAALGPLWLREAEAGRGLIDGAIERVRAQAALGALPSLLHLLARDQATTDQWAAAETSYDEAIRLARETGQRVELAAALAGLAWLEARRGREVTCREHAAEATMLCDELGVGPLRCLGNPGPGRPRARARPAGRGDRALRGPGGGPARTRDRRRRPLAGAGARRSVPAHSAASDDAAAAATGFAARARAKGQPWALARAARCRGLLADAGEFEPCFEEALRLHEQTPDAFETARTRLIYGGAPAP